MKFLPLVFLVTLTVGTGGLAVKSLAETSPAGHGNHAQTTCPVLAGSIDKNVFADYKGKRVYFCCSGCLDDFKKNPEKYINKLEKEGVTLEKTPSGDNNKTKGQRSK